MEATTQHPSGNFRQTTFIEKAVGSLWFWTLACALLFGFPIYKSINRTLPPELPVLSKVPEFRFVDENGKTFGTRELQGKIYIANFMFTTCQTSCPTLLGKIQKVQHRLRGVIDRAAIVSFTVDPENDTSSVLYDKAREMKANPAVWRFLSASMDDTKKLLVEGFKVPVGEKGQTADNIMDIGHSNRLVLVDQEGNIRGYYDTDKDAINQMMIDIGLLINRKKQS